MKKNTKNLLLVVLSLAVGVAACTPPTLEQQNQQKIIDSLKDSTIVIPSLDKGAVSGTFTYSFAATNNGAIVQPETKIQIIRDVDIPKLDVNGKPVIDAKTKQPVLLERKNDVIARETITNKSMFLIANLRPGAVTIVTTANSDQVETPVKIEAGRVTQVPPIALGANAKQTKKTNLNISGKVVKSDGTPVANAKVSDVSGGFVNVFTNTNSEGDFVLPVNLFTTAKNIEVSSGNLTTSLSVTPEQIENITIPLVANSRSVSGSFFDSISKKPVPGLQVKVANSNVSTTTNANGEFLLRGVPINPSTLDVGFLAGYINNQINLAQGTDSNELKLASAPIRPIGNLLINIVGDNYPDPIDFPVAEDNALGLTPRARVPVPGNTVTTQFTDSINSVQAVNLNCSGLTPLFYISNPFAYKTEIKGTIQIEGTDIIQPFTYPTTPILDPNPKCPVFGSNVTQDITVYLNNRIFSVPLNNLPGGEYTLSISLDFHETQKGIKVVIPSRDTISTELIQMRRVKRILSVGDVTGKIVIKGTDGVVNNTLPSGSSLVVVALRGEVDLRDPAVLNDTFTKAISLDKTTNNPYVSSITTANSDGSYILRNVPTGTKVILAGVVNGTSLNADYLSSSYVSLNVVSNSINQSPDMTLFKR